MYHVNGQDVCLRFCRDGCYITEKILHVISHSTEKLFSLAAVSLAKHDLVKHHVLILYLSTARARSLDKNAIHWGPKWDLDLYKNVAKSF